MPENINDIDQMITNAQTKVSGDGDTTETVSTESKGRKRLSPEERAVKADEKDRARAEKRAEKARLKAERESLKSLSPAHMTKVQKAAERLPAMSEDAAAVFASVVSDDEPIMSVQDVDTLAQHLAHHVRVERTRQAIGTSVNVGQTVRIIGGDSRFVGQLATIEKAQRIRCYVSVPGFDKQVYLFISDVEAITEGEGFDTVSDVNMTEELDDEVQNVG